MISSIGEAATDPKTSEQCTRFDYAALDLQTARAIRVSAERIRQLIRRSLDDVIDITSFHTDLQRQLQTAIKVRMEHMAPPHPTWTAVGTTALATPYGVTEIKVVAHIED